MTIHPDFIGSSVAELQKARDHLTSDLTKVDAALTALGAPTTAGSGRGRRKATTTRKQTNGRRRGVRAVTGPAELTPGTSE